MRVGLLRHCVYRLRTCKALSLVCQPHSCIKANVKVSPLTCIKHSIGIIWTIFLNFPTVPELKTSAKCLILHKFHVNFVIGVKYCQTKSEGLHLCLPFSAAGSNFCQAKAMEKFKFSTLYMKLKFLRACVLEMSIDHIWKLGLYHWKQLHTRVNGRNGITFIYFGTNTRGGWSSKIGYCLFNFTQWQVP